MSLDKYWIEPRADGEYLMTVIDDRGTERQVEYLGERASLKDAYDAAMRDMSTQALDAARE